MDAVMLKENKCYKFSSLYEMSCYFRSLIHILLKSVETILLAKAFILGLPFSFSFKEHNPGFPLKYSSSSLTSHEFTPKE